jgi:hypothetical protein
VLDALAINQVDLYGDSYGTYFSQTFAVCHTTIEMSPYSPQ